MDPVSASDLQSRVSEGELWLDEAEFLSQFDDVTVGYPITDDGHLQSIYTGNSLTLWPFHFLRFLFQTGLPSATGNVLTHRQQLAGRWVRGQSAGGSRNSSNYSSNPKFWLKVCVRGEVLVSLLQRRGWRSSDTFAQTPLEENKNTKHQHYQAIALHMWKVRTASSQRLLRTFMGLCHADFSSSSRWRRSVLI